MYLVLGGVLSPGGSGPEGVWSWGHVWSWVGMSGPRGCVWSRGQCLVWGCLLQRGGCLLVRYSCQPVNRMTDRCKDITVATTSLRPVIKLLVNGQRDPNCHNKHLVVYMMLENFRVIGKYNRHFRC